MNHPGRLPENPLDTLILKSAKCDCMKINSFYQLNSDVDFGIARLLDSLEIGLEDLCACLLGASLKHDVALVLTL